MLLYLCYSLLRSLQLRASPMVNSKLVLYVKWRKERPEPFVLAGEAKTSTPSILNCKSF